MSLEAFAEDTEHTQGLVWGYFGGPIRNGNAVRTVVAGTVNLTDNTTNYVFYDWADNAVEVNITGFPSGDYLPIAEIVTLNAAISGTWASRDKRSILQLGSTDSYPMDFRLTLESGVPVSTTAQTAKTTLYLTPYVGNQIALYYNSAWVIYSAAEMSISLADLTASTPYDVWCYSNSGTPTLELLAWTDAATRATALTRQDGILVKSGAATRRYLGSVYINASGGQTDDSPGGADAEGKRYVWNYYNRVSRHCYITTATASWTYGTATWRASNNSAALRFGCMVGVAEDCISSRMQIATNPQLAYIGIGVDSASSISSLISAHATGQTNMLQVEYSKVQAAGYHYYQAMETISGGITNTFYGADYFVLSGIMRG